ncbi:hypothetical protein CCUG60884_00212 [Mycobacteroides salmoniphilum]|uniref:4Fe-4S Wbl-type domain-containing protein n=1 Tax=Mycobacteroides salmoniphilum TaxID=404941 RepID=A0A4R8T034_9MYCO|nr:hypothetical protein CCUG60884_00212 [Mycobacteroides salmoniphilum]
MGTTDTEFDDFSDIDVSDDDFTADLEGELDANLRAELVEDFSDGFDEDPVSDTDQRTERNEDRDRNDFWVETPKAPVACDDAARRWAPDVDEMTPEQILEFRTVELPELQRDCSSCHFRLRCAVNALDSRATTGVYAGVEMRPAVNPNARHRRPLLKMLAEYVANPKPEESVEYEALCARIDQMLARRTELQDGYAAALAAAMEEAAKAAIIRANKRERRRVRGPQRRGRKPSQPPEQTFERVAVHSDIFLSPIQLELALGA